MACILTANEVFSKFMALFMLFSCVLFAGGKLPSACILGRSLRVCSSRGCGEPLTRSAGSRQGPRRCFRSPISQKQEKGKADSEEVGRKAVLFAWLMSKL